MSQAHKISLTAADGHILTAFVAQPDQTAKGGIVILQEVFGITGHMKELIEQYAGLGYLAIVPALFDRAAPDTVVAYSDPNTGRSLATQSNERELLLDIDAAISYLKETVNDVVVSGYCWGGSLSYLTACELDVKAAVSYYGTRTVSYLTKRPKCPVQFHFGGLDELISSEVIEQTKKALPDEEYFIYQEAGHGFNCTDRASFDPVASDLALTRVLGFFADNLNRAT
jgi:carboxymethylenebutenolidase